MKMVYQDRCPNMTSIFSIKKNSYSSFFVLVALSNSSSQPIGFKLFSLKHTQSQLTNADRFVLFGFARGLKMENTDNSKGTAKFKKICVFCGSNPGYRKIFSDATIELATEMVNRNVNLVYGGGSVGLMGLLSQRVYDGGCHVLGIIPKALVPVEISGETVGEVKVVSDMHERKAEMAREAEAFIALPGGYGTMEELLEMITWAQLGIHEKPVGLLNVDGYYNPLLKLFDNGVEEGFIKPSARHIVLSAPTAEELLTEMEKYTPLHDSVASHESWQMGQLGV